MSASATPIFKSVSVTSVGQTESFAQAVRGLVVKNTGPNVAFFAAGAVAPTASLGDGRYGIKVGEAVELPDVSIMQLSFACAAGETAEVLCAGVPEGSIALQSDTTHALIDLSDLGIAAITEGVENIAGPIAMAVPLNAYDEVGWNRANSTLADFMSVSQGETDDFCNMLVDIEVELDGSGTYTKVFSFKMSVTGGGSGGSGGGGIRSTDQQAKINGVSALKAIGSMITNVQARTLLTKTAGSGTPSGAVDFTNAQMILLRGALGATYS